MRRVMRNADGIAPRRALRAQPTQSLPEAIGEPVVGRTKLCGAEFRGWPLVDRASFAFGSAGGALLLGRADAQLVAVLACAESTLGKRVRSRFVQLVVGVFPVPNALYSYHNFARSVVEAR